MKKYINYFKNFFLAPFIIYIFDKMAVIIDFFIPLNIVTFIVVGLLGIPGLVMLIVIYYLFF